MSFTRVVLPVAVELELLPPAEDVELVLAAEDVETEVVQGVLGIGVARSVALMSAATLLFQAACRA